MAQEASESAMQLFATVPKDFFYNGEIILEIELD